MLHLHFILQYGMYNDIYIISMIYNKVICTDKDSHL